MPPTESADGTLLRLPLEFLHRPADPAVADPWLLVLMHGVGSHEADLFGLAPHLPRAFHVLSLRAPFTLHPDAFAWFQFQVLPDGRRSIDTAQERDSRLLVAEVVATACAQLGIPAARTVAGGFSQGGIMSLSLLLTRPELVRAAMVWHGRLLPEALPQQAPAASFAHKALWVSHGGQDGVIPPAEAARIRAHALGLPLALSGADFPGGHELRQAELVQSIAWLEGLANGG